MPRPVARLAAGLLASALLVSVLLAPAVLAQAGALDPTFGPGGRVYLPGFANGQLSDVVVQADGRLLVSNAYAVTRLTPEGAVDPTFGTNGLAPLPDGTFGSATALALLDDGRFYVATGYNTLSVLRFRADGRRDSSFSADGLAPLPVTPGWYGSRLALTVQTDGRLVVAGVQRYDSGQDHFTRGMLARLTADGALDATFGNGGFIARDDFLPVYDVAVRPDGRIVAAGVALASGRSGFGLFRFLPDGTPDPAFGSQGAVATPVGTGAAVAYALQLLPDGRMVLAGHASAGFAVVRYLPDGSTDPSFGTGGVAMTTVRQASVDDARAVVVRPDGRVVAVGYAGPFANRDVALVGYTAAGQVDPAFGQGGVVTTPFGVTVDDDYGHAAALDPAGRVVVAGHSYHYGATQTFRTVVARYLGDATTPAEPPPAPAALTLAATPNPVRVTASVRYGLPAGAAVRLALYDALGREVAVLADGVQAAGTHEAVLDAAGLAPGAYVLRLTAGGDARVARLSVAR